MLTDPMQKREVFHLAFLRAFGRSAPLSTFVVNGGGNLRFFFNSIRYSEDIDLDASGISVPLLRDRVMAILESSGLVDTLKTFGIERVQPPNISRAKQTETVQRFKVHLLTIAGEDLPTRIEFSRRGLDSPVRSESVSTAVLAAYHLAPIIIPHYTALPATRQKIRALIAIREPQARDVFDLYILSSQPGVSSVGLLAGFGERELHQARDRVYGIEYAQYRDTVVNFLVPADRAAFGSRHIWDEIRLRAVSLIERPVRNNA